MAFKAAVVINVIKMPSFLLSAATERSHWWLDLVNREGVAAHLFVY
jgi:hypothetical protein